jgi:Zn-dependent protease with chaperone function
MMDALNDLAALGRALPSWWLAATAWTSVVLVLALGLDRLLRAHIGPGTRALLYAAVLLRAALPSDWHAPLGVVGEPAVEQLTIAVPDADAPASTIPRPRDLELAAPVSAAAPAVDTLGLGLAAIYLLGVAAVGTTVLARLRRGRLAARTEARHEIAGTVTYLHDSLGPMIVGLRHPRVVLPRGFIDSVDREVLTAVVRHELAHIHHRDGWVAVLLALACALAWPIVPVWIAAARIRLAMELRADADALHGMAEPTVRGYRRLLLELATQRWHGPRVGVGLGPIDGLRTRLAAMKLVPRSTWAVQLLFTVPLAIVLLVCAGPRRSPPRAVLSSALAEAPMLALDDRTIPFPHCRGVAPATTIPIPRGSDAEQLGDARAKIEMMTKVLLETPLGSVDYTEGMTALIDELRTAGPMLAYAEARFVRGLSHVRHGRLEAAEQDLGEAAWTAGASGHEHLLAEAALAMVDVAERMGNDDDASAWLDHAAAAQRRGGSSMQVMAAAAGRARARIANRRGDVPAYHAETRLADAQERRCDMPPRYRL